MLPDIESINESEIDFQSPNTKIKIYKGEFTLKSQEVNYIASGDIDFEWYPLQRAVIRCTFLHSVNNVNAFRQYEVYVKDQKIGVLEPRNTILGSRTTLIGDIINLVFGDKSISTTIVKFSVLNLKSIETDLNVVDRKEGKQLLSKRLEFETTNFKIKIDERLKFSEHASKLKQAGGFHILWFGQIESKNSYQISYSDIKEIREPITLFLSFLAGNYVYPMFFKGIYEDEIKWEEFRKHKVKSFTKSDGWSLDLSNYQIRGLWKEYYSLINERQKRGLINKTISWYLEINRDIGNIESQIITAQANLELIYNWIIVDQKQLLKGNDKSSISASNKIRLLLNEIGLTTALHPSLSELKLLMSEDQNLIDVPEVIVYIRNSIVHGQTEKLKFLESLNKGVLKETLTILRWYTEISILKILKFKGTVRNRFAESFFDLEYILK